MLINGPTLLTVFYLPIDFFVMKQQVFSIFFLYNHETKLPVDVEDFTHDNYFTDNTKKKLKNQETIEMSMNNEDVFDEFTFEKTLKQMLHI